MNKKYLIIIDSNSIIHRAYHALPPLTTKKGEMINAVYGFLLVFFKIIKEFHPDYIVACFDYPAPVFRHRKFKAYKAKRPPVPRELYEQIPKVKKILEAFNVPIFEKKGFEADDLIGTISSLVNTHFGSSEIENIILTGDLDMLQLVNKNTKIYLLKKGVKETILYDENLVEKKYQGLKPKQLADFKALKGDPSDNIPGVKGIGEKTAINLLQEFSTIENLYRNLKKNTEKTKKINQKLKELLLTQKKQAFLSKTLAKIEKKIPIDFNLKKYQFKNHDKEKIIKIFHEFEFQSLIKNLLQFEKLNSVKINLKLW